MKCKMSFDNDGLPINICVLSNICSTHSKQYIFFTQKQWQKKKIKK